MIQQSDITTYLQKIRTAITSLIADDLGKYEIALSGNQLREIPAVQVEPPTLKTHQLIDTTKPRPVGSIIFKPNSGIECIISQSADSSVEYLLGTLNYKAVYLVKLTQYNTKLTTQIATYKIISDQRFRILKTIHTPYAELDNKFFYERSEIYLSTENWIN